MSQYETKGGITVQVDTQEIHHANAIDVLLEQLDSQLGALYSSSYEYPGRYTRWDVGFCNPPIVISAKSESFNISSLNERGEVLLKIIHQSLKNLRFLKDLKCTDKSLSASIELSQERVAEELRSKQPSIFSILRQIIDLFYSDEDKDLGLYGAFGYDLVFQFEQLQKTQSRDETQRDLVLFLPDEITVVDHRKELALNKKYEFKFDNLTTKGLKRTGAINPYKNNPDTKSHCDHQTGEYADIVRKAKEKFKSGDLFETVPGQTFFEPCPDKPSTIFKRLQFANPSPYGFLINLGEDEYLVGASPEMYVRFNGQRIETSPISGTIKRGKNAIDDARQIHELLNSRKDESELTMCTDVDRNDKSRICKAGSVDVVGRRQIELYSRLIHTVDHVVGELRDGYDAIDAFLSHMWVVTVTGAPKLWAMQFIEKHEKSQRRWYGGSIGWLGFNGHMNTGLTLRTIHIAKGEAQVRAGATLLYDSDPEAEEAETRLKASAFIAAIRGELKPRVESSYVGIKNVGKAKKLLLVDHQDSFVHTLANYFRQSGADLTTYRFGFSEKELLELKPDAILLSPGPGCPENFAMKNTIAMALKHQLPIFGVCLGLQGLVEYFGGQLKQLDYPMHGKPSTVITSGGKLFEGIEKTFSIGRYHSLYADKNKFPEELKITAQTQDEIIMAIEHKTLAIAAVQFHPESILSLDNHVGIKMIENFIKYFI